MFRGQSKQEKNPMTITYDHDDLTMTVTNVPRDFDVLVYGGRWLSVSRGIAIFPPAHGACNEKEARRTAAICALEAGGAEIDRSETL
jgi:hypothetical protein